MSVQDDERKIRDVIDTWMQATAEGHTDRVLELMAEDVVFLLPGQAPMRGRDAFAKASAQHAGKVRFEGRADVQEIRVLGDYAFCWNHLTVTVTPDDGPPMTRAGNVVSLFRREPDGCWVLFRDANMLVPV